MGPKEKREAAGKKKKKKKAKKRLAAAAVARGRRYHIPFFPRAQLAFIWLIRAPLLLQFGYITAFDFSKHIIYILDIAIHSKLLVYKFALLFSLRRGFTFGRLSLFSLLARKNST